MILVDSSVWIDYFNGYNTTETTELDLLLGVEPIAIGDIILTEVLQGFRSDKDYQIAYWDLDKKQIEKSLNPNPCLGFTSRSPKSLNRG